MLATESMTLLFQEIRTRTRTREDHKSRASDSHNYICRDRMLLAHAYSTLHSRILLLDPFRARYPQDVVTPKPIYIHQPSTTQKPESLRENFAATLKELSKRDRPYQHLAQSTRAFPIDIFLGIR